MTQTKQPKTGSFTPGPWEISPYHESFEIWPQDLKKCTTRIAELMARPHYPGEAERSKANARLIAAAPEMYELLEDVLGLESKSGTWRAIRCDYLLREARRIKAAIDGE